MNGGSKKGDVKNEIRHQVVTVMQNMVALQKAQQNTFADVLDKVRGQKKELSRKETANNFDDFSSVCEEVEKETPTDEQL